MNYEAETEINPLEPPYGPCQWERGCREPATHNVCQVDIETLGSTESTWTCASTTRGRWS